MPAKAPSMGAELDVRPVISLTDNNDFAMQTLQLDCKILTIECCMRPPSSSSSQRGWVDGILVALALF